MDFLEFFIDLFSDYTARVIGLGTAILGLVSGVLGVYAILKKQSLLGDAVAHAALPGIAIAFLITGTKSPLLFFMGAALSGWLATLWIMGITRNTRIKMDTALGMVLAVFFGVGLVLLTFIQKLPNANQSGLETFLFGQAATLLQRDVITMGIIGTGIIVVVALLWKEFKLLTFDPQFFKSLGFNTRFLDILLTSLIVLTIVMGLQTVGVVLMSAMLIAPAAAARQWTDRLDRMIILSAIFGAISGLLGTAISSYGAKISTGPTIILSSVSIVVFSFLFAPGRGLIAKFLMREKNRRNLALNKVIAEMYEICSTHDSPRHQHSIAILKTIPGFSNHMVRKLKEKDLVEVSADKQWCMTDKGLRAALQIKALGGTD
jgi:manganese/zinc/iron transport system permease protein